MHVTLRCGPAIGCLRSARVFPALRGALVAASRGNFRIIQFSAQDDHLHLIVEADDSQALRHGVHGLTIRIARAVNRVLSRHGNVWQGRYHARALTTAREVRFALIYVLKNRQKHHATERGLDRCSSALWFDGWAKIVAPAPRPPPVVRARTWLAAVGWRRHGLIDTNERPASPTGQRARFSEPGS